MAAVVQVPYSTGTGLPRLNAPRNACDCHHHIFDSRIPSEPPGAARPAASVADYRLLQARIGTSRNVVVTASNYGTNNEVTVAAIEQFGNGARGVAVVDNRVTDAELKRLHDKGIRGIRFAPVAHWETVRLLARRVADLGWHIQLNIATQEVVAAERLLSELPTMVVFDHLGRINDVNDPALDVTKRLIDQGRTWVKLSGHYVTSKVGAPSYADSVAVAKAYVSAAPQRIVWGSDWPHPSAQVKPDDAGLFDLNLAWAPEETMRTQILVRNPETLYGFPDSV